MKESIRYAPIPPIIRWGAFMVGLLGSVAAVIGLLTSGAVQFFQSYLFAFLFWIGLSLGSLAIVMMYYVAGGRWALSIQGITAAGARTVWLMLLLFIPILLGLPDLYAWARPEQVAQNEVLQHQSIYLNTPFFIIRAAVYFIIWFGLAFGITRLTARPEVQPDPGSFMRLRRLSTAGLILYVLTMSFAAIDWVMSLQPGWYSSIFGLVIILAQGLNGLAFGVMILWMLLRSKGKMEEKPETGSQINRDLGAVMLAFVMGWAYMSFFQYLIIWAGNIPKEVVWYYNRLNGGWQLVALLIVIAQFALPFFALLSMRVRSKVRNLMLISLVIFAINAINLFWQVMPSFYPGGFHLHWLDFVLPIAMGGLWVFVFFTQLQKRAYVPFVEERLPAKKLGQQGMIDQKRPM